MPARETVGSTAYSKIILKSSVNSVNVLVSKKLRHVIQENLWKKRIFCGNKWDYVTQVAHLIALLYKYYY